MIENIANERGIPFRSVHITAKEQAQNATTPTTTFTLFSDGEYVTNEILSDKKFLKLTEVRK